ncbi:hypothetical protein [Nonomuraea sp. B1E8]|uniref:hypothetical protein n=1 Tax=unclassified Nonomuraea TaxID=2593643 RepID=UPI00325C3967
MLAAVALLAGLSAPAAAHADTPELNRLIDETMNAQLAKEKVPGATVVVVSGGEQIFAKGTAPPT